MRQARQSGGHYSQRWNRDSVPPLRRATTGAPLRPVQRRTRDKRRRQGRPPARATEREGPDHPRVRSAEAAAKLDRELLAPMGDAASEARRRAGQTPANEDKWETCQQCLLDLLGRADEQSAALKHQRELLEMLSLEASDVHSWTAAARAIESLTARTIVARSLLLTGENGEEIRLGQLS